jgi:hypothetical protein
MKKLILILILCRSLYGITQPISNFNAGQVSPLLEGRQDFQKYSSASRTIENMMVTALGPVRRRPGTKYIATVKTGGPRLIPFDYSTDDTYIIEAGDEYMRFFRDGGQILDSNDEPYEIDTDFDSSELWNLRYAQSDNEMYFVDGNDPPQILNRTGHTSWTIEDVNITTGPFLPVNITDVNITPSATTGTVTLEASGDIFYTGHEGSLWQLDQKRESSSLVGKLSDNESSEESPYFKGNYSFFTEFSALGDATMTLERSTDDGVTWEAALTPLNSVNSSNPSEIEENGAIYRVTMSDYAAGNCKYNFTISDQYNHGIVRITDVNDANTAQALVVFQLDSNEPTARWREGYWSDYRGWPKTVVFHQQRLIFGGSDSYPQTLWFGKADPDNYNNFSEGTLDTDSFTISLPGQNPIRWISSQDYLVIGTSGSVGKYGDEGQPITPTSPNYREQSPHGSADIKSANSSEAVLYVERSSRKVREFSYALQYEKYITPDLTILSENITESGIKDISFQLRPDPVLWCVLNNGEISTLTYQRDQVVIAWTKQITDGDFESVAIIPSDEEDEVWVTVKRTIDSNDYRYVEQFQPVSWGSDQNDCFFVDSGLSYSGTATDDFNGLDHLIGKTVSVYADGVIFSDVVVDANGAITIDAEASEVTVGLPYTSKLETLPLMIDPQDKAMNKKVSAVFFDFYQTGYCKYGNGANSDLTTANFQENSLSARYDLYTSIVALKRFAFPYGSMKKQTIYVESDRPMPLCIRAIVPELTISP